MNAQASNSNQQTKTNWEQTKKDADAEAAALEAQARLLRAKQAIDSAPEPGKTAADDQVAAAKAAQALAEAQKAAADAQKAKADAELAALKATIGEVPPSGYTGAVELKDKAGTTEAALLAAKAVRVVADKIVADLPPATSPKKTVLLYATSEVPTFQALIAYRAQVAIVTKGFVDAEKLGDAADQATGTAKGLAAFPILGGAGLALSAINGLLGYFRTDYTIGGVDVSFGDSVLVHTLAGAITQSGKYDVKLPALYNADALSISTAATQSPVPAPLTELAGLAQKKMRALEDASRHDQQSAAFAKAGETGKAKIQKDAADTLRAAAALYDSVFAKLTTADEKGVAPLANVIRDAFLAKALADGNPLLAVTLQKSSGAYYTKKSMWTALGIGMPFYHMGGVVATYVLIEGKEGTVMKAGVVPIHGGWVKANDLPGYVNR